MEGNALPSLGARVRFYRLQAGLTQRGLEKLCALKHPYVTNIEANRVQPRVETLQRLATAFGLCIHVLIPCPPCPHAVRCEDVLCRDA